MKNPFNKDYPFYAIIEVASNAEGAENAERLFNLLGQAEEQMIVLLFRNKCLL